MMADNKGNFVWEDEDTDFDFGDDKKNQADDFGAMLADESADDTYYEKGSQVTGVITKIPEAGDVLIELDSRNSGLMAKDEFSANYEGLSVGDTLTAFFTNYTDGAMILEHSLTSSATSGQALESAFDQKIAVKGTVESSNKGGFEVIVMGKKAFCPISQIDSRFVEKPEEYIGKTFEFLVTKYSGRDVVVSRRDLLKAKERESLIKLESSWAENPIVTASVSEIKDFGLILSIDNVSGLCHISEVCHQRIGHPGERYSVGDQVKAKVIDFDNSGDRPRISLSIKQAEKDPWDNIDEVAPEGKSITGTITRLADFGAFVDLSGDVEGLIHISEMSWEKRVHHPKDVVSVGDKVEVRVLLVDPMKQRISLTMKSVEANPWNNLDFAEGSEVEGTVTNLKSFGAIVELKAGITGLLPLKTLQKAYGASYRKQASPPKSIKTQIVSIDHERKQVLLGIGGIESEQEDQFDYEAYRKEESSKVAQKPEKSSGGFGDLLANALKKNKKN
jgi:small subunit ribosomal protein S1